ncbi:MAG: isoleucine--tRNA ligase [Sphingobacteriales bacterium]|nr:MAG: isoleucine--tRNA ligase [Sphingobacteriales bacterium]
MSAYNEYKSLDLPSLENEVGKFWVDEKIFEKSISTREGKTSFVFYEGPPSANGMPGIHHVMGRAIKDLFCRYKTQRGFQVNRKSGWDTHGLPVELSVEKNLGITKEDIGKKISIEEYNTECRREVLKYQDAWEKLTHKMGYWVDLKNPYITYENNYIETLWWALKQLFDKGLLYEGYTIQPYSPAAGTGLSTHELNQPGCYRLVKDTTVVAQFKVLKDEKSKFLFNDAVPVFFLAWTTTPWTLPSNTALTVGGEIEYSLVQTFNPYTAIPINVILAKALIGKYFDSNFENAEMNFEVGKKELPCKIISTFNGKDLEGIRYEQLLPFDANKNVDLNDSQIPFADAGGKVVLGDFVTTEDGTGIVHTAPSFGSDDFRMAKKYGLGSLTLVDKQGKFIDGVGEFSGMYVKNYKDDAKYESPDVLICIKLKKENKAFKVEKYEHNYPHCWRTDKPVIYYPLDSWFVKTTAAKERMMQLNNTINWKPISTGTGRFGNWLENLQDWNLSRSRFWGTPLPLWKSEDDSEVVCIGSIEELKAQIKSSSENAKQFNIEYDAQSISENLKDLHRPFIDRIFLISKTGKKLLRTPDLVDVWFDSGAMPYAQWHFPFENKNLFEKNFPADFIAEGVDQTRGWFFTLHALATLLYDSVAYKNVVSNGLVLDKNGNKMSKRLGNSVDPFTTLDKYGADATRWYMISNSQPWDNLKFDLAGIDEVKRKFFGTLYNTYNFFAVYANIDKFIYKEDEISLEKRPEIDQWIISLLNSLVKTVQNDFDNYEPTHAARTIQEFVDEHLSNWYVRLCRRRFWKGEYTEDKIAAYQTLYTCLLTTSKLMAPVSPFFADKLFRDLNLVSGKENSESVHLSQWPEVNENAIDKSLEERMQIAQDISSLVLSLRKKVNIKVRQPLNKIMIPVLNEYFQLQVEAVIDLILSEVNVKEIEFITETEGVIKKKAKANFKLLGQKLGKKMKAAADVIAVFNQNQIAELEKNHSIKINLENELVEILMAEVEIISEDIPGWQVANKNELTVALDITITDELQEEGNARELVNKLQKMRKDGGFNITDRVELTIEKQDFINATILHFKNYICAEILADDLQLVEQLSDAEVVEVNDFPIKIILKQKK